MADKGNLQTGCCWPCMGVTKAPFIIFSDLNIKGFVKVYVIIWQIWLHKSYGNICQLWVWYHLVKVLSPFLKLETNKERMEVFQSPLSQAFFSCVISSDRNTVMQLPLFLRMMSLVLGQSCYDFSNAIKKAEFVSGTSRNPRRNLPMAKTQYSPGTVRLTSWVQLYESS